MSHFFVNSKGKTYSEPQIVINTSDIVEKYKINNGLLVDAIKEDNELYKFIFNISEFNMWLMNISTPFEVEYPVGSVVSIRSPLTEFGQKHPICEIGIIQCSNYHHRIYPWHDNLQYCGFYIDCEESMKENEMKYFWKEENNFEWVKADGSIREYDWLAVNEITCLFKAPDNTEDLDREKKLDKTVIGYLKNLYNKRCDELENSAMDILKLLFKRLRGKCTLCNYGGIVSCNGCISESSIDILISCLESITCKDDNEKEPNVISFKLSPLKLYYNFQLNHHFGIRNFSSAGRELLSSNALKELFGVNERKTVAEYIKIIVKETNLVFKKRKHKRNVITSIIMNGIRISMNKKTRNIKLKTNSYRIRWRRNCSEDGSGVLIGLEGRKNDY